MIQIISMYGTKPFNDGGGNFRSSQFDEPPSSNIVIHNESVDFMTPKISELQTIDFMTSKLSEIQTMDSAALTSEPQSMNFVTSKLSEIQPMDEFDINIINLNSPNLWENWFDDFLSFYEYDLEKLQAMVENSKNATILIILPQNIKLKSIELKNHIDFMISGLSKMLPKSISAENYKLFYESTVTDIKDVGYKASFNFVYARDVITKSKNNKVTTIRVADRFILTTLDIMTHKTNLLHFLKEGDLMQEDVPEAAFEADPKYDDTNDNDYPQWLINYRTPYDQELYDSIEQKEEAIESLKNEIHMNEEQLKKNLEHKAILLHDGESLTKPVLNIIGQVLEIDSSKFKNERKGDFLIQWDENLEFIGEVKGVSSNVRSEHVAQIELDYCKYLDDLNDEGIEKEVKALLIMNPFRTVPINDRDPVHDEQIRLASRNESLIIETDTLLYIYGQFLSGRLKSSNFKEILCKEKGLLTKTTVDKYWK